MKWNLVGTWGRDECFTVKYSYHFFSYYIYYTFTWLYFTVSLDIL